MLTIDIQSLDIIGWVTLVIAVLGVGLFFGDLIINIKKHRNTLLNIIGLVFISLSLVSFVFTILFAELELVFMLIAIVFLVGYLVCDVIVAVCIGRQNKREGKPIWRRPKKQKIEAPQENADATSADVEQDASGGEQSNSLWK